MFLCYGEVMLLVVADRFGGRAPMHEHRICMAGRAYGLRLGQVHGWGDGKLAHARLFGKPVREEALECG